MQKDYKKYCYNTQKNNAKKRDIPFEISFEEWCEWWGDDFSKRGSRHDDLCMCRFNDEGPYKLGNIYKDTFENNLKDTLSAKRRKAALIRWADRGILNGNHKRINANGVPFSSVKSAAQHFGKACATIGKWCKTGKNGFSFVGE